MENEANIQLHTINIIHRAITNQDTPPAGAPKECLNLLGLQNLIQNAIHIL